MTRPVLHTPRLVLVPAAPADYERVRAHWARDEVRRYLFDGREITPDVARPAFDRHAGVEGSAAAADGLGLWCLRRRDAAGAPGEFVGLVGLVRIAGDEPELLHSLEPEAWGRGLATEADRALLDHAFDALRLPRVLAGADAPNAASLRVLARLGFGEPYESPLPGVQYRQLRREAWLAARASHAARRRGDADAG